MKQTSGTRNRTALGFGLIGGLAAWILHMVLGILIIYEGCALGFGNVRLMAGLTTLVLGLIAAASTWSAYRVWRAAKADGLSDATAVDGGNRRMALAGLLFSGLFLLLIVLQSIPAIWLNPCAG